MKNVYLIGMMGSGKTTSGKALAKLLSVSFVDLDEQIVQKAGRSINEIFKTEGEKYFRTLESQILLDVSHATNQVVATGGGIVLDENNRMKMRNTGQVIYLKTGLDILWERVKEKKDRPLLSTSNPKLALSELYRLRSPLYETTSDKVFLTDKKTPETVAQEIFKTCFES